MAKRSIYYGLVASALLLPVAAGSAPLSYNYIDLGYEAKTTLHVSGSGSIDDSGYDIQGSHLVADSIFVQGEYRSINFGHGTDLDDYNLGFGYKYPAQENLSLFGTASYEHIKIKTSSSGSASDSGYGLRAGARWAVDPTIELNANIHYVNYGDTDGLFGTVGGFYSVTPQLDLLVDYSNGRYKESGVPNLDRDDIRVAFRYNFAK